MSAERGRRIAVVVVLIVLSFAPVATLLPGSPGSVRVAGIALLWWYAALVAPITSAVAVVLSRTAR